MEELLSNIPLKDALLLFLLILTRWLTLSMAPFLGAELLPAIVRLALAFNLSLVSFILLIKQPLVAPKNFLIPWLFLKEAFLGFLMAFLISLVFHAYQLLGELIDLSRGNHARMLVPELKNQSSPLGVLLFQLALMVFLALGFHREFIYAAYLSFYKFHPFMQPEISWSHFQVIAESTLSILWELATRLALPALFTCFLIDVAFGFLNRAAPPINAYFLSLPAKAIGGLAMLFFTLALVIDDFDKNFGSFKRLFELLFNHKPD